jgi:RNA polymerase sigma factor (sigma-70 family)
MATLRRLLAERSDVEDAWQEACLDLWRAWPTVTSPDAFLAVLLRRAAVDVARRRPREVSVPGYDVNVPCPRRTPLDHVVRAENVDAVRSAVAELHPQDQVLLVERYHHGTGYQDMAAARGTTARHLRDRTVELRRRLRQRLADHHPSGAVG